MVSYFGVLCFLDGEIVKLTCRIGEWALKEGRDRLPLSFTLKAVKD